MRSYRSMVRRSMIVMTAALLMVAEGGARGADALPGSTLGVAAAKQEARYIVVAKVGRTGDVLSFNAGRPSILTWTELKPSAVLKGEINADELNRLPLSIRTEGEERFPRSGEEFVFFVGGKGQGGAIAKMMAKTEENLAAIEAARPVLVAEAAGNLGGGLGSSAPPPEASPAPSDRGTTIVPTKGATGDLLEAQNEFAAAMLRNDPKPEARKTHFAWLEKNEYVRRYDVRQVGWYGAILACEPRPAGGWLIKVSIAPWLVTTRLRRTLLSDRVEETYEFVGGRIRLVESDAALAKPERQRFPALW